MSASKSAKLDASSIDCLAACDSEPALNAQLLALLSELGIESYMFACIQRTSRRADDGCRPEHYRFMVGSQHTWSWIHLYNQRRWYITDSCINYAISNSRPALMSEFPVETPGMKEQRAAAVNLGFRSALVAPAHSGRSPVVGMLLLGSNEIPAIGEPLLLSHRTALRAIALELLEWRLERDARELLARLDFSDRDIALLRLVQDGLTTKELAEKMRMTSSQVNHFLNEVNCELKVSSKKEAVACLVRLGVLTPK